MTPRSGSPRPVMVGRDDELATLRSLAHEAGSSRMRVALVTGEAGVGKSTLVRAFVDELDEREWTVATGYCIEYAERSIPFAPITAILRTVLAEAALDDDRDRHIRAGLAALLPDADTVAPPPSDPDRVFEDITRLIRRRAGRSPLTLVVEDIHWADPSTRDVLANLARQMDDLPLLLILTERTGSVDRNHPLRRWVAEQRRLPTTQAIDLGGLSRRALAEQARTILGADADADYLDRLADRTGGNAFFAHELLVAHRDGRPELPTTLFENLDNRLDRLDDDERSLLRALAIAGGSADHHLLAAMAPDVDVTALARSLYDASVLSIDDREFTFGHALMRDAIMRTILPFEAEDLHRRAAESMAADPRRGRSPADLADLAIHWRHANRPAESLATAVSAAEAAAATAAYDVAADLGVAALDTWDVVDDPEALAGCERHELLLRTADSLVAADRSREAADAIADALRSWVGDLEPGTRALVLAHLAPLRFRAGHPTEADELLDEAVALAGDEVSAAAAEVHHRVSKQAVLLGLIGPAIRAADRAITIARAVGADRVLVEALTTKALGLGVTEGLERGVAQAQEARRRARRLGLVPQTAQAFRTEVMVVNFRAGRTAASLDLLREALDFARTNGGPALQLDVTHDLALALIEAGRVREAEPLLARLLTATSADLRGLAVLHTAALADILGGRTSEASRRLDEADAIARRYQSGQETGFQHRLASEIARLDDRLDDAVRLVDQAIDLQVHHDNVTFTRESLLEKARIARRVSHRDRERGARLLAEVERILPTVRFDDPAGEVLDALVDIERAGVEGALGVERAQAALAVTERSGFGAEHLRALTSVAEERLRLDPRDEYGVEIVKRMRALAEELGAGMLTVEADRITSLTPIELAGESTTDHDLTDREIEVLRLLAVGLTNKQIGAQLFVSHRTVSTHVSNILGKLGLSGRGEAAVACQRLGIPLQSATADSEERPTQ